MGWLCVNVEDPRQNIVFNLHLDPQTISPRPGKRVGKCGLAVLINSTNPGLIRRSRARELADWILLAKGGTERQFPFRSQHRKLHCRHRSTAAWVEMRENRAVVSSQCKVSFHPQIRLQRHGGSVAIFDGKTQIHGAIYNDLLWCKTGHVKAIIKLEVGV